MSESQPLLLETAERLFAELVRADGGDGWAKVAEIGLDGLLVGEGRGGFGGDWVDAFAVMRLAGAHAVAAPVGEAIVAAWLCESAGFSDVAGVTTIASRAKGSIDPRGRFSGRIEAAPWGRDAGAVVFDLDGAVARVARTDGRVEQRQNPAGEPRDVLECDGVPIERGEAQMSVFAVGAFVRIAQIAGALDTALAMSIDYANERSQFGKPIGKFQAVQQSLAVFAEEAAAVNCAAQAAALAIDRGDGGFEIAAAKLRANMAASIGASTAHQVHGAIGFTLEHNLHKYTRRLVSWRSEFGGERYWAETLGADVCARGAEAFWPFLTARGDSKGELA
ncbi:acyl-CoA dehydrogenase family protein [Terricaulis silvestris]|uniref:Glutaryl-CoA dehydrogenase n=1 Tax=Terricaulis silvestris TaxID=2686094 RepID=A0A6I6MLV6_9CAUL|nr:acyl-CoA dehydrogenase family protein [Terricaulis silvestris]QGZ96210.1 Glutaryl-CoA dehydrogenase [Terricaulis silvestris]